MEETNWEYCEVRLEGKKLHRGNPENAKYSYDCWIEYYLDDKNDIALQITKINYPVAINPFQKVIAFLGKNGWELVSTQMGNAVPGTGYIHNILILSERIAILKRPIKPDRQINEPEFIF